MLSRHFVSVVEVLVENGPRYADLSVEAIITAGGISRSTFYVYFEDKGDLLVAMAQDVIGDLLADGASWWELPVGATREDLHKALRVPIDTYRKHRTILGTVAETAAYDPRVREQQRKLIDQVVTALTTYIGDAQRAGVADVHLDAARTAQWLIWMIERGLYQLVGAADNEEAECQLDALTEIVWRVVYLSGRAAAGRGTKAPASNPAPKNRKKRTTSSRSRI
jgi:TetR/AcrR family transcriptional regulator, ethionamide resistance regulator